MMMKQLILLAWLGCSSLVLAQQKIPDPLKTWEDWATWEEPHGHCPTNFNDAKRFFCHCPSRLSLQADSQGGHFSLGITVFHKTWVFLPGDSDLWPLNIQANGKPVPVVEKSGQPAISFTPGTYQLTGDYRWKELPQKIRIPVEYGIVSLSIDGKSLPFPNWDGEGFLWLKRNQQEEGDKDFLGVKVYRMIEDGVPMWLQTILELSVSGKSREVELGNVLPEGWSLSSMESPIPVAVDDQGAVKAQVRAGKWLVELRAFRTIHSAEFKMRDGSTPLVEKELVCFKANPEFRMLDIGNAIPVDVTQTTFPAQWREWPVYQWNARTALTLDEKMRGSGLQSPKSMTGIRNFWLNEKGRGFTYQDRLTGEMQNIWRMDVPSSLQLGSVKINGEGQLITRNPKTGGAGVEIRSRNINLEALGTSNHIRKIPATGWDLNMDSLTLNLNLPPGWRLLALFGAESVDGDWLTSWTLLDLFLLLIFSLAVYRLWGIKAGLVALFAFGLTYHEPGSPRYTWFFLLIPLALLKVIPEGKAKKLVSAWKYAALVLFLIVLVPFTIQQVQSVIYPQLEPTRNNITWDMPFENKNAQMVTQETFWGPYGNNEGAPQSMALPAAAASDNAPNQSSSWGLSLSSGREHARKRPSKSYDYQLDNMVQEPKARIQTGPGIPDWRWRTATCSWHGPVSASQTITPILISPWLQKILMLTGLALVFWQLLFLMGVKNLSLPAKSRTGVSALLLFAGFFFLTESAFSQQIPDKETLETLKKRLLKPADCYPHCAEIPSARLTIKDNLISCKLQVDAAIQTSVPLPGRLPLWSPIRVEVDGKPEAALRRTDGYLWIVVSEGVHRVKVEGLLPGTSEWEWSFLLKPRTISLDAPSWNITGLRKDGTPEQQIFFSRKQTRNEKQDLAFDRREFQPLAMVSRTLEIGLTWQIHNTVTRLSTSGKAISLQIPLLPGEQVLSSNIMLNQGNIEVRLAANQESFSWESELPMVKDIKLEAPKTDRWVEQWHLVSSPVWNVTLAGLSPVIEATEERLIPSWHPWPGENVQLEITRPEAVTGPTMTIHRVQQEVALGNHNRNSTLKLMLQCSMGDDLVIGLDPQAEISSVKCGDKTIPVRREKEKLVVPVQPGMQNLEIVWKETRDLKFQTHLGSLSLPVESSNITTIIRPPQNRWILWAHGPLCGPAVRFWGVLACGLLAAWILGRLPLSPLNKWQWTLLMVGLTQVHLFAVLVVVGWLFLLSHRGHEGETKLSTASFNFRQFLIVLTTATSLGIFLNVVYNGLLGNPEMFIIGNGSSPHELQWYAAQSPTVISQPELISVSVWFYRFLMLLWALWLAASLVRWLAWGWKQFSQGGWWQSSHKSPPPLKL